MAVLVLADHDLGTLSPSTARIIAGAGELGPLDVLVAGEGIDQVALAAGQIAGVAHIHVVQDMALNTLSAEALVPVLERLAPNYTHIIASAGAVGRDVMPRLAARLDIMPITDIVGILGPNLFQRPIYAGNALQTVRSNQQRQILTLRASAFRPAAKGNEAPIEPLDVAVTAIAELIAAHRTEGDAPDLSTAQIVVGGGQSVKSKEGFALVEQLARRLKAAVGATRAAVDSGYAPNDWQVGQTGKIIAPDLYIGIGISGALQHLAGIQGAKKIIAVNSDPEAPIVKIADVALIGDLFEILPQLTVELEKLGLRR
jgi:electron transfer flavoprotein alpha subunit